MALDTFNAELGFGILEENGAGEAIKILRTDGAPDGTSGGQSDAPIGSLLLRSEGGSNELYQKIANAGASADWSRKPYDRANDIFLTAAVDILSNGTIADGDSVEVALGYLQANQDDLLVSLGISQGDIDMGTYTGTALAGSQNTDQRAINQALGTAIDNISGGSNDSANGVTTATRLGAELVDNSNYCEFEVTIIDSASPSNKQVLKIGSLHDGTPSADATVVDFNKFSKLKVGSNFNYSISVTLSGAGVAQDFAIEISSTEPSGVDVVVRKVCL